MTEATPDKVETTEVVESEETTVEYPGGGKQNIEDEGPDPDTETETDEDSEADEDGSPVGR